MGCKDILTNWNTATQMLADAFVEKYYGEDATYTYWVGGEVGDIFFINDDFYDVTRMRQALELNATLEQLQDYQEMEMEIEARPKVNFKNYVKYYKEHNDTLYNKYQAFSSR